MRYGHRSVEVDIPALTKPKVQAFLPERESRYKVSNLLCTQELLRFNRRPEFAPYLIFVRNARNAVSVKFLAECKKIPEKNEKITVLGSVYIAAVMYYFTLSVYLHSVCNFTLGV